MPKKEEMPYILIALGIALLIVLFVNANKIRKFEKPCGQITIVVRYNPSEEHIFATNGFFSSDPERDVREGHWNEEVVVKCKDSKRAIEIRNKILEILKKN